MIIIAIICLPFITVSIINNIALSVFEKQLLNYQMPQQSEFIESQSILGKLNGNGDGIDFFSSILIKSGKSIDELKDHYKPNLFKNARSLTSKYSVHIEVLPVTGPVVNSGLLENVHMQYNYLDGIESYDGYYFIIIYDGGYSAFLDIRGT